ncbi:MAG: hypothetical protein E7623_00465 [Ruminococcaceae bacterium]|nr:hypothetical protein [Oscillospiraceae bacterium]
MKKRILSFLLCILLVVPCVFGFTGCSEDEEEYQTDENGNIIVVDDSAITLTLYGIKNEGTTDAAIERVEAAINEMTKSQFSIQIDLRLFEEDEYYAKLETALETSYIEKEELEKEKETETEAASGDETETETEKQSVETFINANGLPEIVYPKAGENQVDIFLVTSADKITDYDINGWLSDLTTFMSGSGSVLNSYINPNVLKAGKGIDGAIKSIPNNGVIGEYTYLLVNKELADKYYYDAQSFSDFLTFKAFLDDVMAEETEDYLWMLNEPDERLDIPVDGTFYGHHLTATGDNVYSSEMANVVLGDRNIERLILINDLLKTGNLKYGDIEDYPDQKIATAFVKGSRLMAEKYSDEYYTVIYNAPLANDDTTLDAMYALSSTCASPARAYDILKLLATSKEFINLLAYGIEGVDYEIKDGIVTKLNNDYSINLRYCGNQFLLETSDVMDEETYQLSLDDWKLGKEQNLDARASLYLGFKIVPITEEELEEEGFEEETETEIETETETEVESTEENETVEGIEGESESETEGTNNGPVVSEPFDNKTTAGIIEKARDLYNTTMEQIAAIEEYEDEEGNVVSFGAQLRKLKIKVINDISATYFIHKDIEGSIGYQFEQFRLRG